MALATRPKKNKSSGGTITPIPTPLPIPVDPAVAGKKIARRKVVRGADGRLRVIYIDEATGNELESLTGYTIDDGGSDNPVTTPTPAPTPTPTPTPVPPKNNGNNNSNNSSNNDYSGSSIAYGDPLPADKSSATTTYGQGYGPAPDTTSGNFLTDIVKGMQSIGLLGGDGKNADGTPKNEPGIVKIGKAIGIIPKDTPAGYAPDSSGNIYKSTGVASLSPSNMTGGIYDVINSAAAANGVPTDTLVAIAEVESAANPNAVNKSGAAGLFQIMPDIAKAAGIDPMDPAQAAEYAAKTAATNTAALTKALNRPPTPGEIYLAHQQGLAGATAILTHPDLSAVDALSTIMPRASAIAHVTQNLSSTDSPNITAGNFAKKWNDAIVKVYPAAAMPVDSNTPLIARPVNTIPIGSDGNPILHPPIPLTNVGPSDTGLSPAVHPTSATQAALAPNGLPPTPTPYKPVDVGTDMGLPIRNSTPAQPNNSPAFGLGNNDIASQTPTIPPNGSSRSVNEQTVNPDGSIVPTPSINDIQNQRSVPQNWSPSANDFPAGSPLNSGIPSNPSDMSQGGNSNQNTPLPAPAPLVAPKPNPSTDPVIKNFLIAINQSEGSPAPNQTFGYNTIDDMSQHPNVLNTKYNTTAAGTYQINNPTWQQFAPVAGVTDFSPASQDAVAWAIASDNFAKKTGGGDLYATLQSTNPAIVASAFVQNSNRWITLPNTLATATPLAMTYMNSQVIKPKDTTPAILTPWDNPINPTAANTSTSSSAITNPVNPNNNLPVKDTSNTGNNDTNNPMSNNFAPKPQGNSSSSNNNNSNNTTTPTSNPIMSKPSTASSSGLAPSVHVTAPAATPKSSAPAYKPVNVGPSDSGLAPSVHAPVSNTQTSQGGLSTGTSQSTKSSKFDE